jgi:hypothetical protein
LLLGLFAKLLLTPFSKVKIEKNHTIATDVGKGGKIVNRN